MLRRALRKPGSDGGRPAVRPQRPPTPPARRSCACGAVRYAVADAFEYAANCHCSNCRRATGSAFKPFAGIRIEKLQLVAGADGRLTVGDPDGDHDTRCRQCGSLLYSVVRDGAFAHVAMGTLIEAPSIRPTDTFSSARRRRGTRSRTGCRSMRNGRWGSR